MLSTRTNSKLTCFTPAGKLPNYFVVRHFREQHKTFAPFLLGNHSCICVSWSEIIFAFFYFDQLVVGRNNFLFVYFGPIILCQWWILNCVFRPNFKLSLVKNSCIVLCILAKLSLVGNRCIVFSILAKLKRKLFRGQCSNVFVVEKLLIARAAHQPPLNKPCNNNNNIKNNNNNNNDNNNKINNNKIYNNNIDESKNNNSKYVLGECFLQNTFPPFAVHVSPSINMINRYS